MWIALLAAADHRGIVLGSRKGIAHMANMTPEQANEAMAVLAAPDPDSSSPEHEGRRIEWLEGGVQILNHGKYRDTRTQAQVKAVERTRRWRERQQDRHERQQSSTVTPVTTDQDQDQDQSTEEGDQDLEDQEEATDTNDGSC